MQAVLNHHLSIDQAGICSQRGLACERASIRCQVLLVFIEQEVNAEICRAQQEVTGVCRGDVLQLVCCLAIDGADKGPTITDPNGIAAVGGGVHCRLVGGSGVDLPIGAVVVAAAITSCN